MLTLCLFHAHNPICILFTSFVPLLLFMLNISGLAFGASHYSDAKAHLTAVNKLYFLSPAVSPKVLSETVCAFSFGIVKQLRMDKSYKWLINTPTLYFKKQNIKLWKFNNQYFTFSEFLRLSNGGKIVVAKRPLPFYFFSIFACRLNFNHFSTRIKTRKQHRHIIWQTKYCSKLENFFGWQQCSWYCHSFIGDIFVVYCDQLSSAVCVR